MTSTVHEDVGSAGVTLSDEQVAEYHREGYLLLEPAFLGEALLSRLQDAVTDILQADGPQVVREKDDVTIRSVYGPHRDNLAVAEAARDTRLAGAARRLLDDVVYVHQSKLNVKAAFSGDRWDWHQDFVNWLRLDGIQRPDLVNVAVFLDDVSEFNGPLMICPRSHTNGLMPGRDREGMPEGYEDAPSWVSTLTSDEQYQLDPDGIRTMVERNGLISAKGRAGSLLFFHGNILHASLPNISPTDRKVLILVFNGMQNAPTEVPSPRPGFLAERPPVAVDSD